MRVPRQVGHLVRRSQVRCGVAMTIEAKGHAQRFCVIHLVHLVDIPVTVHAAYPAVHVDGVVEINVVGHLVNLHPLHRFAGGGAFADRRQARVILQHLVVAIHACLARGYV